MVDISKFTVSFSYHPLSLQASSGSHNSANYVLACLEKMSMFGEEMQKCPGDARDADEGLIGKVAAAR